MYVCPITSRCGGPDAVLIWSGIINYLTFIPIQMPRLGQLGLVSDYIICSLLRLLENNLNIVNETLFSVPRWPHISQTAACWLLYQRPAGGAAVWPHPTTTRPSQERHLQGWGTLSNGACHPGGYYWEYYPGAISLKSNHCNSFHPYFPSMGARSWNCANRTKVGQGFFFLIYFKWD